MKERKKTISLKKGISVPPLGSVRTPQNWPVPNYKKLLSAIANYAHQSKHYDKPHHDDTLKGFDYFPVIECMIMVRVDVSLPDSTSHDPHIECYSFPPYLNPRMWIDTTRDNHISYRNRFMNSAVAMGIGMMHETMSTLYQFNQFEVRVAREQSLHRANTGFARPKIVNMVVCGNYSEHSFDDSHFYSANPQMIQMRDKVRSIVSGDAKNSKKKKKKEINYAESEYLLYDHKNYTAMQCMHPVLRSQMYDTGSAQFPGNRNCIEILLRMLYAKMIAGNIKNNIGSEMLEKSRKARRAYRRSSAKPQTCFSLSHSHSRIDCIKTQERRCRHRSIFKNIERAPLSSVFGNYSNRQQRLPRFFYGQK